MKLIAHRGLIYGPDRSLENSPNQILSVLNRGYDCEIDLWIDKNIAYLGHDGPQYLIDHSFLLNKGLWIHAKNLEALYWLLNTDLNYFWHQQDHYTLTSHKFIWTYPGENLTEKSVMVLPEWVDPSLENINKSCYGICSDYIEKIKTKL